MTVTAIDSALPGEHVLAVVPRIAFPQVDAGWLRRLRLFTGRGLDDVALTAEQQARGGRLAVLGQTIAPGVVLGLEVSHERASDGASMFHITAGYGLLPSGEDVVLGRDLVIARSALAAIDNGVRAAILTLVPVTVTIAGRFDPLDPCARDESDDAFADKQRVDAVQVELVPWQAAWDPLDATSSARNQLAYIIYELERKLPFGEVAPWQVRGLPLALVGLDGGAVTFLDRHAVVRAGGHAPSRAPLVSDPSRVVGNVALWQARILQLADHLADARDPASGKLLSVTSARLATLPPAGLIPRDAIDFATLTNKFFPPTWRLRAAPIPSEQLDSVLARAAALAPLSAAVAEDVLVLAPVPQAVYEPNMLLKESESPEFQQHIDEFVHERTDLLGRRAWLRTQRDALVNALDPAGVVPYPDPDPERLEDEGPINPSGDEATYDTEIDNGVLRSSAMKALRARLDNSPALVPDDLKDFYTSGLTALIGKLTDRAQQADDAVDFGFLHGQANIYRLRQKMLGTGLGTKLATSPVLAGIAQGDTASAVRSDLQQFYDALKRPPRLAPPASGAGGGPRALSEALPTRSMLFVPLAPNARDVRVGAATGVFRDTHVLLGKVGILRDDAQPLPAAAPRRPAPPSPQDIRESSPVVGAAEFRTVTLGQRIEPAYSDETRGYALATRHDALQNIVQVAGRTGLKISDLTIYGVPKPDGTREPKTFGDFKDPDAIKKQILDSDTLANATEEAHYFHDTVTILEAHIATLRGLEGRVAQLRDAIRDCTAVAAEIGASQAAVDRRIGQVEHDLADRRHAVATARALFAEEVARVARINGRRAAVLAEHVTVIGYVRPRFFEAIATVPEIGLEPELLDQPVPACLTGHDEAPPQIAQMVALLREAPLSWLRYAPPILRHLDRVELMHGLVITARQRTAMVADTGFESELVTSQLSGRFGARISAIGRGQLDAVWQARSRVAEIDLNQFAGLSWLESREAAQQLVSIGDLIEGRHGRPPAITEAHATLVQIEKVAGCLWAQAGQVTPLVRLGWAETLDAYEAHHQLVTLSALPRWLDVPYLERKRIQVLAEWLLDQANPSVAATVAWFHDLVRACILLASHSPIDEIISGDVPIATPAGPGTLVPVHIDPSRIRIGMHVSFFQASNVVAQGIVEDLVGEHARARIADAVTNTLRLEAGTRARFALRGSAAAPLNRELA
jgi:hypothetical protein